MPASAGTFTILSQSKHLAHTREVAYNSVFACFLKLFIGYFSFHLKGRKAEINTKRDLSSTGLLLKCLHQLGMGQAKAGTQPGSLTWMAGTHILELSPAASRDAQDWNQRPGLKLGTLIQDAGIPNSFNHRIQFLPDSHVFTPERSGLVAWCSCQAQDCEQAA